MSKATVRSASAGMAHGLLAAVFMFAAAGGAWAQARPRLVPTRDVTVTYRISDVGGPNAAAAPHEATLAIAGGGGRIRIASDARPGYAVFDRAAHQLTVVAPGGALYFVLPMHGEGPIGFMTHDMRGARFTRVGAHAVAGLRCTEWQVASPKGNGQLCATADGVVLQARGVGMEGRHGAVEATSVSYAALPESTFAPPPGAKQMTLPQVAPAMPKP
ncbi:MAG TPA: hypothetical protein VMU82_11530 [Acetobacteraceae bacterium]|nr:hypothetical protein [Acetobacteraceae bacterium]